MDSLKIGTRGSPLALVQANMVRDLLLEKYPQIDIEIVEILTSGDWRPEHGETRLNAAQGGKGQFAKEIEKALLSKYVDIAVHSMKDMETTLPEGLCIRHMLPREDVSDILLINNLALNGQKYSSLSALPEGLKVGTSSVRRQAMLLAQRPDFEIVPLRGNVQTRLEKLTAGQVDATLLAAAGLRRLGLYDALHDLLGGGDFFAIPQSEMLPAAGQGAVGIEMRTQDAEIAKMLDSITCRTTFLRVLAERNVLDVLDGSCHTPIGCYAVLDGDDMYIKASVAALDGGAVYEDEISGTTPDEEAAAALGRALGMRLRESIPPHIFEQMIAEG